MQCDMGLQMQHTIPILVCIVIVLVFLCIIEFSPDLSLQVYTTHHVDQIAPTLVSFRKHTRIDAHFMIRNDTQIAHDLEGLNDAKYAGIIISSHYPKQNLQRLIYKPNKNLYDKLDATSEIASQFLSHEKRFIPIAYDPYVILYNSDRIKNGEIRSFFHLIKPKFRDKIAYHDLTKAAQLALTAGLNIDIGAEKLHMLVVGLQDNVNYSVSKTNDIPGAVARGDVIAAIALYSEYVRFVSQHKNSHQNDLMNKLSYVIPTSSKRGAIASVSWVGITASGKDKNNATSLVRFLVSKQGQYAYKKSSMQIPMYISSEFIETPLHIMTPKEYFANAFRVRLMCQKIQCELTNQ